MKADRACDICFNATFQRYALEIKKIKEEQELNEALAALRTKEEEVKTLLIEAENKRLKEQQQLDETRLKENTLTSILPNTSNNKSSTTNGSTVGLARVKSLIGENVQMHLSRTYC